MLLVLLLLFAVASMPGVICFRAGEWCLDRRRRGRRSLVFLALAVLGAGTAYGLLRLMGIIVLPGDNTYSVNFFDASWRDDGVRWVVACGGSFAGAALALMRKKAGKPSLNPKIEEKS